MHGCLLISICNLDQGGLIEGPSSYLQGGGGAQGSVQTLQSAHGAPVSQAG